MPMNISTKYIAIAVRRPTASASTGASRQPMMVPIARIAPPYDARRPASANVWPSRSAICVTAVGT